MSVRRIPTLRQSILRWATLVSAVGLPAGCGDPPLGPIREPTTNESGSPSDSPVSQTVSTDLASLGDTVSVEFGIVVPAELDGAAAIEGAVVWDSECFEYLTAATLGGDLLQLNTGTTGQLRFRLSSDERLFEGYLILDFVALHDTDTGGFAVIDLRFVTETG